jgi:PAS domain S-box-containing protein
MNILHLLDSGRDIFYIAMSVGTISISAFKYIYRLYNLVHKEIIDRKELSDKVNIILSEVTPNHGTSLKDTISRIECITYNNEKMIRMIGDRQKWILDKQNIPIFESDSDGMCTWANDAYLEFLKRDSTEVLGNGWRNFIHEDDRVRVVSEWEKAVTEGRSSQSTYRMINKDGEVFNVECYATKHIDNGYSGNIKIK